jgi:mannose-6-phosphate isomerase-like protein (cupin superfamily)
VTVADRADALSISGMGNYTVKNLKQVDNMAEQFGLAENLEARFARKPLELSNFGVSYEKFAPGFRMPFGHTHGEQEEVYVVISGGGRIKVGDEIVDLTQWDAIRVPGDVTRALEGGAAGMEILAIGAPQANDTEMTQGWWSD